MIELHIRFGTVTNTLTLDDGEYTVGRASQNDVQIPSSRASKHHAVIRIEGERLYVRDLGSTNGTAIDGVVVGEDEVEVPPHATLDFAGATLQRSQPGDTKSGASAARLTNRDVSMIARYNQSEGLSQEAGKRFLKLSSELFELLASEEGRHETAQAACRFVGKSIAAERVVLLEDHGEATSVEMQAQWTREKRDDDAPLQLSSTIIRHVLDRRDTVLVSDIAQDPRFGAQESIMALHLRSAMAAPLFDNERVRGILYVDSANPGMSYTPDDLQVLTATANAVAVKLRNLTLEREMKTAAEIQRSMLPAELQVPDGYEIDAYQLMCREVGGDLYHCSRRPNGTTLIALGDVSGKGTPAALAMTAATVLIGMLAKIGGDVLDIATQLHQELFNSLAEDQFITLFIGELNPKTGRLHYVNAGHDPPLLYHLDGTSEALQPTGIPIAMMDDARLESAETTVQPGDLVAIFSDGIPEATTEGERFLGLDPVKRLLEAQLTAPLPDIRTSVIDKVNEFLDGKPSCDDVTLLLLRRCTNS